MPNTFLNCVLYRDILFSFICKQKFLDNTFVSLFWWEKWPKFFPLSLMNRLIEVESVVFKFVGALYFQSLYF